MGLTGAGPRMSHVKFPFDRTCPELARRSRSCELAVCPIGAPRIGLPVQKRGGC